MFAQTSSHRSTIRRVATEPESLIRLRLFSQLFAVRFAIGGVSRFVCACIAVGLGVICRWLLAQTGLQVFQLLVHVGQGKIKID